MSLRYRLLIVLLGAAVLTTLTATGATYYWARHEIDELLDYQLRQQALALRDNAYVLGSLTMVDPDPEQHVVIQLWDRRGVLRYLSHRDVNIERPQRYGYANVKGEGEDWRVYATELGPWIAQLAQPLRTRRDIAANAALRILYPTLAILPLLALLIWWVVGRVLAPMSRVADAVAARDSNALEPLPSDGLPREVALMVDALNALIARLRDVLTRQQEFMADAAHELRTPLTAVKLQAQLLERAANDSERRESLLELKSGIDRSSHLVERLLALARLDQASTEEAVNAVDLAALVRRTAHDFIALAHAHDVQLHVQADESATVEGRESALQGLIGNLLDNALRYTPAGGRVDIQVTLSRRGVKLMVQDTGIGIPIAERARVCDRFYRVPGTAVQGSGLGLAIVKRVADIHAANLQIEDTPGGGTRIVVDFMEPAKDL